MLKSRTGSEVEEDRRVQVVGSKSLKQKLAVT